MVGMWAYNFPTLSVQTPMADQTDNRPIFTIVMGCNGVGKSVWKRRNYDRLPLKYFDQDSIAGGIGDWNCADSRDRTRRYVDDEIDKAVAHKESFGVESTFSGRPGPTLTMRMKSAGYRIEGVYLGTEAPAINARRVEQRVAAASGHWVDPNLLPVRHKYSLSNLRKHITMFDQLEVFDNSTEHEEGLPQPIEQCVFDRGELVCSLERAKLARWCARWMDAVEQSGESKRRAKANRR